MYTRESQNNVLFRLLLPECAYLPDCFKRHDALYYPSEDVVFIVTKQQHSKYLDNVYTEIAVWNPGEIRLLGALTLSVPEGGGVIVFVPFLRPIDLSIISIPFSADLSSDTTISSCLEFANRFLTPYADSDRILYELSAVTCSASNVVNALFDNIDPSDGILMRGLYTLMKSQLLVHKSQDLLCHNFFMEEAFINLQVSREAALQKIRERLHSLGNPNPSYRDAHNYIRSNFQMGKALAKYFEMQHESWIEAKHPISVYGTEWAPTLSVDDIYATYGPLVSVYRHIILGEPGRSSMLPLVE